MRMRNGPPGPSMVCSRTAAMSARRAIRAMRTSYCARATSMGKVCVAGTPAPLSSSAWICGSTGIACELLGCTRHLRRTGRQKAIEHLPRAPARVGVIPTVEHPNSVDEDTVNAQRVADGARSAARQVVDPARPRDADSGGIELQQVGAGARRDAAPGGDAVEPGLVAGQAPHAFGQVEGAALANPVPEEVEAEPGSHRYTRCAPASDSAMTPPLCLTSGSTPSSTALKKRPINPVSRSSSRPRSSSTSSGSRPLARAMSAIVWSARPAFYSLTGAATMTRCQLPWKHGPRLRVAQIAAEKPHGSSGHGTPI